MPPVNEPEFYVGYQPHAAPGLARRLRHCVALLAVGALGIAAALTVAQRGFDASRFEFLQYRDHRGTIWAWPYPVLAKADGDYLLAGEGKFGAAGLPTGFDGREADLQGALAASAQVRVLELRPDSLRLGGVATARREIARRGRVTLSGEIVDLKCHAGVMNPGRGKVHRDCAARCLSGGLPPGLLAFDAAGTPRVFVLTGRDGARLALAAYAGEPVTITGDLVTAGSLQVLETSLSEIERE